MKIAIRLDDITENMDWAKFLRFKEMLDERRICPLIGVVPENKDEMLNFDNAGVNKPENFWEYVKALRDGGWIIAMHGYNHIYGTKKGGLFPLNDFSEFAGLPFKAQYDKLKSGKDILADKGIETDIFMAPAHSYDKNTLRALKELSFNKITDGFNNKPYISYGMEFYPIAFKRSAALNKGEGYTTFVVHTNTMTENDFMEWENMLSSETEFISYSEYLDAPKQKRGAAGVAGQYLKALFKHYAVRLRT